MSGFAEILSAASQLPVDERMRLIDELTNTLPTSGGLSPEWLAEVERRSAEIDAGIVDTVPWETVRGDLYRRVGLSDGT
jgi:putative addiction module component (TIGR02574 family)